MKKLLYMYKYRSGDRQKVDYSEEFLIKQLTISKFHCILQLSLCFSVYITPIESYKDNTDGKSNYTM